MNDGVSFVVGHYLAFTYLTRTSVHSSRSENPYLRLSVKLKQNEQKECVQKQKKQKASAQKQKKQKDIAELLILWLWPPPLHQLADCKC